MKEHGQVVVLLLLVMLVAMAIGLSTIGRSNIEVSTSRKSEDSSRAFSAAEAGIEKALGLNSNNIGGFPAPVSDFSLDNFAGSTVTTTDLPETAIIEYPPFGKESFAQLWLVDPDHVSAQFYTGSGLDIYFGDPNPNKYNASPPRGVPPGNPDDKPAIEVNITYFDGITYQTFSRYFDTSSTRSNGFIHCTPPTSPWTITTNNNTKPSNFYCKVTVTGYPTTLPIMVRIKFLYTNISHPLAIKPVGGVFPKQVNIYKASGISGNTKRTLEVFQQKDVMPAIFDYALFSATAIEKH